METPFKFSYKNALLFSLNSIVDNWKTFFLLNLICFFTVVIILGIVFFSPESFFSSTSSISTTLSHSLAPGIISSTITRSNLDFSVYVLIFPLITMLYYFQIVTQGMALYRGKKISLRDSFSFNIKNALTFFRARLLFVLKCLAGFFLFVIPGFYLLTKNYFAGFTIAENPSTTLKKDTDVTDQLTKMVKLRLLLVFYVHTVASFFSYVLLIASLVFPPLFIIWSLITAFLGLIDIHIYKQMKEARLSQ